MSENLQPDYFKPQPGEAAVPDLNGERSSRELRARRKAFSDYEHAVTDLSISLGHFHTYSADGLVEQWSESHNRRIDHLNTVRDAFYGQIDALAGVARPVRDRHGDIVTGPTPDKLERWPGETPEEHEHRLFKDFGIRIPDESDFPVDTAFFLPKPPDMPLELLTHIRDLLAELVAKQTSGPAINFNAASVLDEGPAKLWESLKGVSPDELNAIKRGLGVPVQDEVNDKEPAPASEQDARVTSETVLAGDPDIGVGISRLDDLNRVAVRLKDRTAYLTLRRAVTLADQIKRTADALGDHWIAPAAGAEGDDL